jgi:phosphoribosylformimino-5-aminoimidazole carboxamide ribotide isomerase
VPAVRVIGVLDLLRGEAVHARAGPRETYAPVSSAHSSFAPGDALALAREYVGRFGLTELYVADLDAIMTASRQSAQAFQDGLVASLAAFGAALWLDAGTSSVAGALQALALGATFVVVGLETLPSFDALEAICVAVGGHRVAFSLDLRRGVPVTVGALAGGQSTRNEPANRLAARAAAAGAGHICVIDLARVGLEEGPDFGSIASVREAAPGLTLVGGGGVRGLDDLRRLAEAGCDGVLVGTALHQGRLKPADITTATGFHR